MKKLPNMKIRTSLPALFLAAVLLLCGCGGLADSPSGLSSLPAAEAAREDTESAEDLVLLPDSISTANTHAAEEGAAEASAAAEAPTSTPVPTAEATPVPTETPDPTATPTPDPTATPTPAPTATPTPAPTAAPTPEPAEWVPEEDGTYTSKDEVAAYIHAYGHLPDNYITKREAEKLGWVASEGNLWKVAPGKSIGGSGFGNYEGLLPDKKGRRYYECDIDYSGGRRNAKRIIYSNDGLIFYTDDHYNTFEKLYG